MTTVELYTATKLRRFVNYVIDFAIFRMLLFPAGFLIGYTAAALGLGGPEFWSEFGESAYLPIVDWVLTISVFFFYYFAFEVLLQRTPGKFITGTKVVSYDGAKPTTKTIALRTLSRLVPFEPFSFLGKETYGWHDKWSGTTVVKARRTEQVFSQPSLQTEQSERLTGITALLEKECTKKQPQEETLVQARSVPENSAEEKQSVVTEQIGTVEIGKAWKRKHIGSAIIKATAEHWDKYSPSVQAMIEGEARRRGLWERILRLRNENVEHDSVVYAKTATAHDKEQVKWFALAILIIVLVAIIAVRFSDTPAATRADRSIRYFSNIVSSEPQRDLSTPSSRLVGHWRNVKSGDEVYFSPIDPDLRIGTYRYRNKSDGSVGPPFWFKVIFENSKGTQLVLRDYDMNEEIRKVGAKIGIELWQSDVTYTISKQGQSMTAEYIFSGNQTLSVFRYIDNKTSP